MNLKQDVLPLLRETWQEFQEDEAGQLGAALAYYATFSIFPLLLLLLALLGFVLSYWPVAINAQDQILAGVSQALLGGLAQVPIAGGVFGYVIGLVVTVGLSTLVFALLFKYLPNTRVGWGDVWLGALITAIVWEIAKRLLALYVDYSS